MSDERIAASWERIARALRVDPSPANAERIATLVEAAVEARDAAHARADAMYAIIEGRTTPPTDEEIAVHGGPGCSGWWLVSSPDVSLELIEQPQERDWCIRWGATQWLPIDLDGRPCAWPIVTEVTP